jgi:hypothetical protein
MVVLVTAIFLLVIIFSISMSLHTAEYRPTAAIEWEDAKPDPFGMPKVDTDMDGLPDIEENYVYGTDIFKADTDSDGMDDYWEVQWFHVRDPLTEGLLIDPVDPLDAYEDPDGDGYDFDRNGRIDHFEDMVALSVLDIPPDSEYGERNIKRLLQNPPLYDGLLVRLTGIYVMDNTTYGVEGARVERELTIRVAEDHEDTSRDWLQVVIRPFALRPAELRGRGPAIDGPPVQGDRVDVQGVFRASFGLPWLEVRGGEQFPNIMEYRARFPQVVPNPSDPDLAYSLLDPTDSDTDDDGMCDGWESRYGEGYLDPYTGEFTWVWKLDPTDPTDAQEDLDGDGVEWTWRDIRGLWVDPDGDGVYEPPGGASPNDAVLIGVNLHEYMFNTDPRTPDTDNDSYPPGEGNAWDFDELLIHGTDPAAHDTDGDGMWDGWEIHHSLLPTNDTDRFADGDSDGLINYREFLRDTDPWDGDTDGDTMGDGWEVENLLDPLDPRDAWLDPDEDLLANIQEYLNGTNPRDPDTDRDFLSDYEEVVVGWYVTADGKAMRYFTLPMEADTDRDDVYDDEDGDGNYDPNEEILDGIDNDGDSGVLQNNGIDDDGDGIVDDGRNGIPAIGLPEGVDEEHDLNDYNEVYIFHTNASNPDTDGEGLDDWYEWFTDLRPEEYGIQRTQPTLSDTDSDRLTDKEEMDLGIILPNYGSWGFSRRQTDPLNPDTDSDGLMDGDEVLVDYDLSSMDTREVCDPTNPDTDGDMMLDGFEFDFGDVDGDGLPTWWERDNSGIFQRAEFRRDADINGVDDILDDWDGDGLTNLAEYRYRLDPWDPEEGRAYLDLLTSTPWHYIQRTPVFSDGDGDLMPDWWEIVTGLDPADPTDRWADGDLDMLVNIDEYIFDLDPFDSDTDGDGFVDLLDHEVMASPDSYDGDGDGISDWFEHLYPEVLDPANPEDADRNDDGDNWTNYEEFIFASDPFGHAPTDPTRTSTDGDVMADDNDPYPLGEIPVTIRPLNPTREVQSLNPIRAVDGNGVPEGSGDMDRDGLNNSVEYARDVGHTNPTDPDTDGDGMPDGWEIAHAEWDPLTAKPNLNPLDPDDPYDDPDWDGVNFTLDRDEWGNFIIGEDDHNRDGKIDPVLENETFCNLEEYLFGIDLDRNGINDVTPHPNKWDTDGDGIPDGWEALLSDRDGDALSNWFELVGGLNPFNPTGVHGADGDPDQDGYSNLQEFHNNTHPTDPESHPGVFDNGGLGIIGLLWGHFDWTMSAEGRDE